MFSQVSSYKQWEISCESPDSFHGTFLMHFICWNTKLLIILPACRKEPENNSYSGIIHNGAISVGSLKFPLNIHNKFNIDLL